MGGKVWLLDMDVLKTKVCQYGKVSSSVMNKVECQLD